jgi:membrane-associated phospholipid phosphatase
MKDFIRKNSYFLIPWVAVLLSLLPVLLCISKARTHLFINQWHNGAFDYFFRNITFLGDGVVIAILVLIYLFISYRQALCIAASGIIASIIAQILKRFVFFDTVRPAKYFEGNANLHFVEGVKMFYNYSFPSGHSATVFALAFCLAAFTQQKILKIVLFCTAIVVAYSRIYLSQHFLVDAFAGSIIGVLSALVTGIFFNNNIHATWLNGSLRNQFPSAKK